jgi:hypothetical protein
MTEERRNHLKVFYRNLHSDRPTSSLRETIEILTEEINEPRENDARQARQIELKIVEELLAEKQKQPTEDYNNLRDLQGAVHPDQI